MNSARAVHYIAGSVRMHIIVFCVLGCEVANVSDLRHDVNIWRTRHKISLSVFALSVLALMDSRLLFDS